MEQPLPDLTTTTTDELLEELSDRFENIVFAGIPKCDSDNIRFKTSGNFSTSVGIARLLSYNVEKAQRKAGAPSEPHDENKSNDAT
jgi:hypothetical protein